MNEIGLGLNISPNFFRELFDRIADRHGFPPAGHFAAVATQLRTAVSTGLCLPARVELREEVPVRVADGYAEPSDQCVPIVVQHGDTIATIEAELAGQREAAMAELQELVEELAKRG